MSSTTKQYAPTATARPTWREREAQKERQQRETVLRAKEAAEAKKFAKTEENFPTTMKTSNTMVIRPPGKFAELASKMPNTDAPARRAKAKRPDTTVYPHAFAVRSNRPYGYDEEEDYEEDYESTVIDTESLEEQFPPHGKRGTYTAPDIEGWRLVTKRTKKLPRELTEAELVQKYRDTFFGEGEEGDEDHNGDLNERNQRREFY